MDQVEELQIMLDFFKEGAISEEEVESFYTETINHIEDLEFRNMLSDEGDSMSAVLQITAGAGGTESCDWASMLMRMYLMWGEKQGYKIKELNFQEGDVAGIKTVTLEFEGEFAFGYLKGENGVHRLVRISPFDSNARRHTSFASVNVYPLVDDTIKIEVNPADVKMETSRSGGAGGQNVNKRETAVRMTHVPTGLSVYATAERSQEANRDAALKLLSAKVWKLHDEQERAHARGMAISATTDNEWGSQIRSYTLHPYKLIKDHRTGFETGNIEKVLEDGYLDEFIEAEKEL